MEQKLKSEITQHMIIDKAFALFYQNGFKSTSIDKIMEATQLTKGAFYHHFKDKKEIGLAVIGRKVQKRIYDGMISPLYAKGNELKILKSIFTNRIRSFTTQEKQSGCPANNLINEIGDTEKAYQLALRQIIDEWKAALISLIDRGKKAGSINRKTNNASVAVYLISAFEGVRGIRKLYNDDQILEEYLTAVENYIEQLV